MFSLRNLQKDLKARQITRHMIMLMVSAFAGQGSGESFKYEGTRKRKGARKKSERRSLSKRSEAHEKHNKSVDLYSSLKSALVSLCTAFKQPAILR